eukprot:TRINITY_DN1891_c0_g1_i1.p1 TRINITY_DN1891_c0_g1~~TRINITY_DN1891_c0_g1_i1.p1  ORF type:complete len:508 (+),score=96.05 TRINITY_DN1891_c0_g1_i1:45-1568(+)
MPTFEDVPDYIQMAIPFFVVSMLIEITIGYLKGWRFYRLHDSISSLSAGTITLLMSVFIDSVAVVPYDWIWRNYAIMQVDRNSTWGWIVAFLGVDLAYYWFHRAGHRVNIGWATHAPHHSSEDYNLSTALRQGCVQTLFSFVFNLPMAFFLPPQLYIFHRQWNTIYQFWIHTKAIGKLGFLEYIINTPSHHRVHHARNPIYIDKNYAGTLIIWDRMFGTFEEEKEEVGIPSDIKKAKRDNSNILFRSHNCFQFDLFLILKLNMIITSLISLRIHTVFPFECFYFFCLTPSFHMTSAIFLYRISLHAHCDAHDFEQVAYGLVHNLDTWDALYAQYHHLLHIFTSAIRAKDIKTAFHIVFDSPAWTPEGELSVPPVNAKKVVQYDTVLPFGLNLYVTCHFTASLLQSLLVLVFQKQIGATLASIYVIFCILSLATVGFLMDANPMAKWMEITRHLATLGWIFVLQPGSLPETLEHVLAITSAVSIGWTLLFYKGFCKQSKRVLSHEKSN